MIFIMHLDKISDSDSQ